MSRRLVAFSEGSAPDDRGRFIGDVLRFDDEKLEDVHDFIQWLFPLPERSGANPLAPILDDAATNDERRISPHPISERTFRFWSEALAG